MLSKSNILNLLALFMVVVALVVLVGVKSSVQKDSLGSKSSMAVTIKNTCSGGSASSGGKETCYSQQFRDLALNSGPEVAFSVLDTLQKMDRSAVGCHLISHGIGSGAYKRDPNNWQTLIQNMSPSCNYGAIHGVLEGYINSLPDKSLNKTIIPTICGTTPRADCNHIVGHLILVTTDGDVKKGLDLCDVFTDKAQLEFCYTGIFMEEETALNLVSHGLADKSWLNWTARLPELDKMCRTFSGEKFKSCWTELVHVVAVAYHNDAKAVFDYCSRAPSVDAAKGCKYHGIGIMAASYNFDLRATKPWCDLEQAGDPDFKANCYVQLAASSISTIPGEQNKVKQFCESLETPYQTACLGQVNSYNKYEKKTGFSND